VDTVHSYRKTVGTGAQIASPAWSGWSVLDKQTSVTPGAGYMVGQVVTLTGSGTVNGGHWPKLVVESLSGSGIASWDWLDYGSFSITSPPPTTLTDAAAPPSPFSISNVRWTGGPLATTIKYVDVGATDSDIYLTDPSTVSTTATMDVLYFYYGDDDGALINKALASGGSTAIHLPGQYGTTREIDLPQDTSANMRNAALVGDNFESTGLYAFGPDSTTRSPAQPLLSRVVYQGLQHTSGGGVGDMFIDGLGIAEGYGYYGFYSSHISAPLGYVGPSPSSSTPLPTAGDVIEVDGGALTQIDNIYAENALGTGNAVLQCGLDEEFPDPTYPVPPLGAVANIIVSDSRLDSNGAFSGATNPDFVMKLGRSCHDSIYQALSVYDGTKADILQYNGSLFSAVHLNSDAVNGVAAGTIPWMTLGNPKIAGVADYGFYIIGNASLSQTQCDIANITCVYTGLNSGVTELNPAQITDTQMKCGSLSNVQTNYYAVEVAAGAVNTSITGTASAGDCNVPGSQLVHVDLSPLDPSVSICNNSAATVVFCGPAFSGFAAGQSYTQPAPGFSTVSISSGMLYAVPFETPIGGTVTKIKIDVPGVTTSMSCELGVYASNSGAPGALILDAGATPAFVGPGVQSLAVNLMLSPHVVYFLAVGCSQGVTLEGSTSNANLSGVLSGLRPVSAGDPNTALSGVWMTFGPLPMTFPTLIYANAPSPNVYVTP